MLRGRVRIRAYAHRFQESSNGIIESESTQQEFGGKGEFLLRGFHVSAAPEEKAPRRWGAAVTAALDTVTSNAWMGRLSVESGGDGGGRHCSGSSLQHNGTTPRCDGGRHRRVLCTMRVRVRVEVSIGLWATLLHFFRRWCFVCCLFGMGGHGRNAQVDLM